MRPLTINAEAIQRTEGGSEYIPLGAGEDISIGGIIREEVRDRINRLFRRPVKGFWGTLGKADDGRITWRGELHISKYGNDASRGVTGKDVDLVKEINPHLEAEGVKVIERFISFDNVEFDNLPEAFTEDQIPRLRLTVMVQPDEGAIVFYQHTDMEDDRSENGELEYIQPEPTGGTFEARDRLDYIFPVLPKRKIISLGNGTFKLGEDHNQRFVVKILTFTRKEKNSRDLIDNLVKKVFGKKYTLQLYNPASNEFQPLNTNTLNKDLKTLLLVHGTFSTTTGSYEGLLKQWHGKSFLERIMTQGRYQQVIGIDHPTIVDGGPEFKDGLLDTLGTGFKFSHTVDGITTSGGGPRLKYLANTSPAGSPVCVERFALVTCANGVGYFTFGHHVARFLSIARKVFAGTAYAKLILGFLQLSAQKFLDQPGAKMMTPGSAELKTILKGIPANANTRYLPVIGDYDISMNDDWGPLKRWGVRGADELVKLILGKHHDWVVGTKEQYIMPKAFVSYPGYDAENYEPYMEMAGHMSYLKLDKCTPVQNKVFNFLHELPADTRTIIYP